MKHKKQARIYTNEQHEPYRIEVMIDDTKMVFHVSNSSLKLCHRVINDLVGNCPRSVIQVFGNANDKREC